MLHVAFNCRLGIQSMCLSAGKQLWEIFDCSDIANPNFCFCFLVCIEEIPLIFLSALFLDGYSLQPFRMLLIEGDLETIERGRRTLA